MRVLVTGASGFIGRRLCAALVARHARVWAASRTASPQGAVQGCEPARLDLRDRSSIEGVVEDAAPEVVFHLAAAVSGRCEPGLVVPMLETNLVGTAHLLEVLAARTCRRVVLAGSCDVPLRGEPVSPYALSKAAAGQLARTFSRHWGLSVVEARIFMAYGPGQSTEKVIPYAIVSLLEGDPPLLGLCRRRVDPVFVDDVVEGLIRTAEVEGLGGEVVDLGSGRGTELRGVVERVAALIGGDALPRFGAAPDRPEEPDEVARAGDSAERLGWCAGTGLEEGLATTVAWYREQLYG